MSGATHRDSSCAMHMCEPGQNLAVSNYKFNTIKCETRRVLYNWKIRFSALSSISSSASRCPALSGAPTPAASKTKQSHSLPEAHHGPTEARGPSPHFISYSPSDSHKPVGAASLPLPSSKFCPDEAFPEMQNLDPKMTFECLMSPGHGTLESDPEQLFPLSLSQ